MIKCLTFYEVVFCTISSRTAPRKVVQNNQTGTIVGYIILIMSIHYQKRNGNFHWTDSIKVENVQFLPLICTLKWKACPLSRSQPYTPNIKLKCPLKNCNLNLQEVSFVPTNTKTLPIRRYLMRSPQLTCQHSSMQHSMLNRTHPIWLQSALVFLSALQKIRFLPPGYHHHSRLICPLKNKHIIHLQVYYYWICLHSLSGALLFRWRS